MISRPRTWGFMLVLSLAWALALGAGFTAVAQAASEDVAMFYDELSQYGQWADYQNYGPVWRPTQVPQDWRPYTDGRWTPTDNGYVFETQEPWGWATYHYGNWMPTEGYGWVWVPGSTWYPSTVDWRTTPENAPEADSYVGWAPIPPPNYEPPPAYAPPSYYQGSPITDLLTAPFWIFVKAASFLLGLGQPYAPAYSYIDSGYLVPPAYVPVFYPQTIIVQRYYTPAYYPPAYYGVRSLGYAAYNWGPPVGYVSRVTRINQARFNRIMYNNSVNLTRIHNVVAPRAVLNRYGYIRHIVPPALAQGRRLPVSRPVKDFRRAQANLYKPNILPPPRQVPAIRGQIPRIQPAALAPGHGLPGTALPARATMRLTPQMTRQIEQLPPGQRLVPARAQPFKPAAATRPGPGQVQPQGSSRPGSNPGQAARPQGEFQRGNSTQWATPGPPLGAHGLPRGPGPHPRPQVIGARLRELGGQNQNARGSSAAPPRSNLSRGHGNFSNKSASGNNNCASSRNVSNRKDNFSNSSSDNSSNGSGKFSNSKSGNASSNRSRGKFSSGKSGNGSSNNSSGNSSNVSSRCSSKDRGSSRFNGSGSASRSNGDSRRVKNQEGRKSAHNHHRIALLIR
jgi:hypothetical protein